MTQYSDQVRNLAERHQHAAIHILYDPNDESSGHICWLPTEPNLTTRRAFFRDYPHNLSQPLVCPRQQGDVLYTIVTPAMVLQPIPTTHSAWR